MTTSQPSSSDLCLACGLCCSGAMYYFVPVQPDEVASVEEYGLKITMRDEKYFFTLPCPMYHDQKCSIYATPRTRTCHEFKCKLLRAYEADQVGYEQALQHIRTAQRLHADLRTQLGAAEGAQIWQMVREMAEIQSGPGNLEFRRQNPELALNLMALRRFMNKYFYLTPPQTTAETAPDSK